MRGAPRRPRNPPKIGFWPRRECNFSKTEEVKPRSRFPPPYPSSDANFLKLVRNFLKRWHPGISQDRSWGCAEAVSCRFGRPFRTPEVPGCGQMGSKRPWRIAHATKSLEGSRGRTKITDNQTGRGINRRSPHTSHRPGISLVGALIGSNGF